MVNLYSVTKEKIEGPFTPDKCHINGEKGDNEAFRFVAESSVAQSFVERKDPNLSGNLKSIDDHVCLERLELPAEKIHNIYCGKAVAIQISGRQYFYVDMEPAVVLEDKVASSN